MNIKHFERLYETLQDLRKDYKRLAIKNHPDLGGNADVMKEINSEYDYIVANIHKYVGKTDNITEETLKDTMFKGIIDTLITLEGLEIELVGSWIWLSGKTYENKEVIKDLGFRWAKGKKKWYYTKDTFKKKRYKQKSLNELKTIYGCETISSKGKKSLA